MDLKSAKIVTAVGERALMRIRGGKGVKARECSGLLNKPKCKHKDMTETNTITRTK